MHENELDVESGNSNARLYGEPDVTMDTVSLRFTFPFSENKNNQDANSVKPILKNTIWWTWQQMAHPIKLYAQRKILNGKTLQKTGKKFQKLLSSKIPKESLKAEKVSSMFIKE